MLQRINSLSLPHQLSSIHSWSISSLVSFFCSACPRNTSASDAAMSQRKKNAMVATSCQVFWFSFFRSWMYNEAEDLFGKAWLRFVSANLFSSSRCLYSKLRARADQKGLNALVCVVFYRWFHSLWICWTVWRELPHHGSCKESSSQRVPFGRVCSGPHSAWSRENPFICLLVSIHLLSFFLSFFSFFRSFFLVFSFLFFCLFVCLSVWLLVWSEFFRGWLCAMLAGTWKTANSCKEWMLWWGWAVRNPGVNCK